MAAAITVADLWSKARVFELVQDGTRRWVLGDWFGFTKVWNAGTMWGGFQNLADILPWVRVLAAGVVIWMMLTTPAGQRWLHVALGLVLGGALGNIYDGFVYGRVRDFLMVDLGVRFFDPFPIFNVADSAICVGVAMLALSMWSNPEAEEESAADADGSRAP